MRLCLQRLFLFCLLLGFTGCVSRGTTPQLAEAREVLVAFVHHNANAPVEFQEAVVTELTQRNFSVKLANVEKFGPLSNTQRMEHLRAVSSGGLVLLIESSSEFYSQLEGRFRWTVRVNTEFSISGAQASEEFSAPALLNFDHEDGVAALRWVTRPSARKIGELATRFVQEELNGKLAPLSSTGERADAIYFVLVDRFANGDQNNDESVNLEDLSAFHGGDLRGLIEKLDYIRDLGFTKIWISPVWKMRTEKFAGHGAFHGYWTEDLVQVEPRFGSEEELIELAVEMRKRDMGLILDMVLNHVGYDAPLLKQKPAWFHRAKTIVDWNDPDELTSGQVHGLPDLAQENPEVSKYLIAASVKWMRALSPAGFRLDAVKHVPTAFWREYNQSLHRADESGQVEILGELFDGTPSTVAATWKSGGFDMLFDFPLYFAMVDTFCKKKRHFAWPKFSPWTASIRMPVV